jgi:membrane protein YqaA with SNARE-associated domain
LAYTSRAKLARRLAKRRARVVRWPGPLAKAGFAVVRAQARVGHGFINAKRRWRRGLVEVPDHLISTALRVHFNLSTPLGRQILLRGLKNPGSMTQDQRSAVVVLTLLATAVLVLVLNSIVALAIPEASRVYRQMLFDAGIQLVGLFGAPIPIEPFFVLTLLSYGAAVAFSGFFAGKMLGAWVLILLGDSLHDHLKKTMKGQRSKRMLAWLTTNANKYGFGILVLDNCIPFAPDQLMLVFAVAGMRTRDWLLGIALGTAIKFGAMILAVDYYGPELMLYFFEHPLEFLQGQRPAH